MNNLRKKIGVLRTQIFIRLFGKCQWISDRKYNEALYYLRLHKKLHIDAPKSFNEHVMAIKVLRDDSAFCRYTDKYAAREYVETTIGKQYLNHIFGIWTNAEDIDFSRLPKKYILKATHGSGWNIIVQDNDHANSKRIVRYFRKALKKNYYFKGREKNYRDISPRVMCEELLEPINRIGLVDFKVFCFRGIGRFFTVEYREDGKRHYGMFDEAGLVIPLASSSGQIAPIILEYREKLFELAAELSKPFDFVRCDFYLADNIIRFSELTFHSGGGIVPFEPIETDLYLGRFFDRGE